MSNLENMKAEHCDKLSKAKASKLLGNQGSAPDVIYSKSCANKEKIRPYKTGGSVKKSSDCSMKKFSK